MKRIFVISCYKSILWGALFFLGNVVFAANFIPDSTAITDTVKLISVRDTLSQPGNSDTLAVRPERKRRTRAVSADSVPMIQSADTLVLHTREHIIKSPQRASILSAVIPGLGQAYNGKYWKIPIIYGGAFVLYHRYDTKNQNYVDFKEQLDRLKASNASTEEIAPIEQEVNKFNSQRSYAIIFLGLLYVANVVDAMTDAYFLEYDISDDLNIGLSPSIQPTPGLSLNNYTCGFTLSVQF